MHYSWYSISVQIERDLFRHYPFYTQSFVMRIYQIQLSTLVFLSMLITPAYAQSWQVYHVGEGIEPMLALTPSGEPHISYMLEGETEIKHAIWNPTINSFDLSTAVEGSFYGPVALDIDPQGIPHISYHDHDFGNVTISSFNNGAWQTETVDDEGHDGWDSALYIDEAGNVHIVSVDPDRSGLDYAYFDGTDWTVEAVGSENVYYDNGVSIKTDSQGRPHIAYYDNNQRQLMYAVKERSGWTVETVAAPGVDGGRYPALELDDLDQPVIAFYAIDATREGIVALASKRNAQWEIKTVENIGGIDVSTAVKMIDLELDSANENQQMISFSDTERILVMYGDNEAASEVVEQLPQNNDDFLGLSTSLKQDKEGNLHLAYFKYDAASGFRGHIYYAFKPATTSSSTEQPPPTDTFALSIYPSPSHRSFSVNYTIESTSQVGLSMYNIEGKRVWERAAVLQSPGEHLQTVHTSQLPAGWYWLVLQIGNQQVIKAHAVLK